MQNEKALVVLSGGQDSVTCLGMAIKSYEKVHAISFNYGQQHGVELECAIKVCERYSIPHKMVDMRFFKDIVTSSLTGKGSVNDQHPDNPDLPASFVPNRNAILLTVAHAYAQKIKASFIFAGMCQTDYSGYPDCRREFITALDEALYSGSEQEIHICTPFMELTKAEIFKLAADNDFLTEVIENSHTCYEGDHSTFHDWGYGCAECPACKLRKKGWEEYKRGL